MSLRPFVSLHPPHDDNHDDDDHHHHPLPLFSSFFLQGGVRPRTFGFDERFQLTSCRGWRYLPG